MGMAATSCDRHHDNKFSFFWYLKDYIQNLIENDFVVSEENKFYFSYLNDLGVAEGIRSLHFSALNHSIISPLCLV